MILLPLALAALSQDQGATFLKPAWSRLAVPRAVDHVAVMTDGQTTLTRSGPWMREDLVGKNYAETTISNVETGFSYHFTRDANGGVGGLTITGRATAVRQTVRKTRETHRLLGEICTVWLFSWDRIVEHNCLTRDGVLLWQRVVGSGNDISSSTAASIVRRRVLPAEVSLPAGLLNLSFWGGWRSPTAARGDTVWLTRPANEGSGSLLLRRLGLYSLRDEVTGNRRFRTFQGDGITLNLHEMSDGRLERLDLSRTGARDDMMTPAVPEIRKTILGENCTVYGHELITAEANRVQCRTADGLILEEINYSRGRSTTLTATRIERGATVFAEVAPPANVLRPTR